MFLIKEVSNAQATTVATVASDEESLPAAPEALKTPQVNDVTDGAPSSNQSEVTVPAANLDDEYVHSNLYGYQ